MFPSAVTALTGAGKSQSPERAGRERARLGKRESAREARGECSAACASERPGPEGASPRGGVGGVRARDPESGSKTASCGWVTRWLLRESARRRRSEAGDTLVAFRSARPRAAGRQETEGKGEHKLGRSRGRTRGQRRSYTENRGTRGD